MFGHKTYCEYKETLSDHLSRDSRLRATSSNTVFAVTAVSFGPHTCTPPHLDAGNTAHGWCTDTAVGEFDPDKGGHLVLWDLRLVIRFPPGSTILFPSALVTHSNILHLLMKLATQSFNILLETYFIGGITDGAPIRRGLPRLPGRRRSKGKWLGLVAGR